MLLIACISPSIMCAQETLQTLQFAKKATRAKIGEYGCKTGRSVGAKSSLDKLREAYEKERQMREHLETFISENNVAELKAELEEVKKQNQDLSIKVQEMKRASTPLEKSREEHKAKHVRFRSRVENEDSLDSEQKERMEHNLKYRDDTIFENISIFRELQDPKQPYDKYFREPVNLNAGYVGDKRNESDSSTEYVPKGKFALLNNSLTLQHEKMNTKHGGEAEKKPEPASPTKAMHIEESVIVPNADDSNSLMAYESLKRDLDHFANFQQQSSMGDSEDKNNQKENSVEASPTNIAEMYKRILDEIGTLRKIISQSKFTSTLPAGRKLSGDMIEKLKEELFKLSSGESKSAKQAIDIVNQMQNIFENLRELSDEIKGGEEYEELIPTETTTPTPKKRPLTPELATPKNSNLRLNTRRLLKGSSTPHGKSVRIQKTAYYCFEETGSVELP